MESEKKFGPSAGQMDRRRSCDRHLASMMLGFLALAWAPLPYWAQDSIRLVSIVQQYEVGWMWTVWWAVVGSMLVFGSFWPCRGCRMGALGCSAIGWFAFFGMYVKEWQYSPSTVSMFIFGCMSVITLISDSRRKPRDLART